MTNIKTKRRRLFSVVRIEGNGLQEATWVEKTAFTTSMVAPITWKGQPAELHFWNYKKRALVNVTATDLFARDGFVIRGPVLILTGNAMFSGLKTQGSKQTVERQLHNLGLSAAPIIIPTRDWLSHSNVYTRDQDDLFAIRMCLA